MATVKILSQDTEFLTKAYAMHPEGSSMNLSTLAVYDDDAVMHNAASWQDTLESLEHAGYLTVRHTAQWNVDPTQGPIDVGIFTLTPLGRDEAQAYFRSRLHKTFRQRFHSFNWTTWGGVSAVVAAIASIVAVVLSYLALPR
jgi:hypothetical protein